MRVCIIYHSETGNTRRVAQHLASSHGVERLIEVTDKAQYNRLTGFVVRCSKARGEKTTPISPGVIDVDPYDLIVMGSPVWAFKPTPVIHAAINALKGYAGKPVVGFFTHGGMPGDAEETFTRWCEERWLKTAGTLAIHMKEIDNEKKTQELADIITSAGKSAGFL